ncbi:MAG: hypothetical protein ABSG91_22425, partial [Syntrophobacteraceae bacterium]
MKSRFFITVGIPSKSEIYEGLVSSSCQRQYGRKKDKAQNKCVGYVKSGPAEIVKRCESDRR